MASDWRNDPLLKQYLHPDYPDDLQVLVHDGGPRITDRRPEAVWVHVLGVRSGVFSGEVLNQPRQLLSVKHRDTIDFIAPESGTHPIMVRQKYLDERADWIVSPCSGCGLSELFDAPSDIVAKIFPGLQPGEVVEGFTTFCTCGGVQTVRLASSDAFEDPPIEPPRTRDAELDHHRWWKFWKQRRSDA